MTIRGNTKCACGHRAARHENLGSEGFLCMACLCGNLRRPKRKGEVTRLELGSADH